MIEQLESSEELPSESLDNRRFKRELEVAISRLPVEQAEVFRLRQIQGEKFDVIAEITGTPVGTVKSRMRYAMLALQEALAIHDPREVL